MGSGDDTRTCQLEGLRTLARGTGTVESTEIELFRVMTAEEPPLEEEGLQGQSPHLGLTEGMT